MSITPLNRQFVRLALAALPLTVAATTAVSAQEGAAYEIVTSFDNPTRSGANPMAPLLQASDGHFYGTTTDGGESGRGTIFRVTASGGFESLHSFRGEDGAAPMSQLIEASDGSLYGTTRLGGAFDLGTVFKVDSTGRLTTLHSFDGDGGAYPEAGLTPGFDGMFYGTTMGLALAGGTIFRIDAAGTFTALYRFTDRRQPHVALMQARDGNLYGATGHPASPQLATVFKIDPSATVTTLHTFVDGQMVPGPLLEAADGFIYGVTRATRPNVNQIFYRLDSTGTLSVIRTLGALFFPRGALIQGSDGYFYGTASSELGPGTVFRIDATGALITLHDLDVGYSGVPTGLIQAADGSFYGTTTAQGTTFRFDLIAGTTVLHTFGTDGAGGNPATGVIQGSDGRLYGTAPNGGVFGRGTVFTVDATGAVTPVHSFEPIDGRSQAGLVQASDGRFYGTTDGSPKPNVYRSTVFRLDSAGSFATLHRFETNGDPQDPRGTLLESDGYFYGPSVVGGTQGSGSVFRVDAAGAATTLHSFTGGFDLNGRRPYAGLVRGSDLAFYGTTSEGSGFGMTGTVFRIDAVGSFATVHRFNGPDGAAPMAPLRLARDGRLYGTTSRGGSFAGSYGTVFAIDAAGTLATLYEFHGPDGFNPYAGLLQATDGNLYGTTCSGGASYEEQGSFIFGGYGSVFKIDAKGQLTTLHSFSSADGDCPSGELIQASDGHLYGTTQFGGSHGAGVLFRVRLDTSPLDQYYELVSRNSGKCLDVFGASTEAGASAIQWVCHGGPNQQWRLEPAGGGAFHIIARHSGQALDIFGASLDDVTPIIQWPPHGGDNQVWTLEPASNGYVSIVARHSGKALDVEYASTEDGARVIQYTPHGGANQQWLLRAVGSAAAPITTVSDREP
jgi:uncharacterized repeat protein (TIGR03803 family)